MLQPLTYDKLYDEYVTNVQTFLKEKEWHKAYAPWFFSDKPHHLKGPGKRRCFFKVPELLHKTLQHNLVDFIDVNRKLHPDTRSDNPLRDALDEGDVVLAKKLIARGAEVNATMLRSALYGRSTECTELLLETNPKAVNEKDVHGDTPLFYALYGAKIECAALLIKFGANLKAKDGEEVEKKGKKNRNASKTALERAKYWDRKEYVKLLTLAEVAQKSIKKEYFEKFQNIKRKD